MVLRQSPMRDRPVFVELFASARVREFLGGPRARAEPERSVPVLPGDRPGAFVTERKGPLIGIVTLDRREASRPGHVRPEGGEVELGYVFLPDTWGQGYAAEACRAALGWLARTLPGEPVVLCTQLANERSVRLAAALGFREVDRLEEFAAKQGFGVLDPASLSARGLQEDVGGRVPQ